MKKILSVLLLTQTILSLSANSPAIIDKPAIQSVALNSILTYKKPLSIFEHINQYESVSDWLENQSFYQNNDVATMLKLVTTFIPACEKLLNSKIQYDTSALGQTGLAVLFIGAANYFLILGSFLALEVANTVSKKEKAALGIMVWGVIVAFTSHLMRNGINYETQIVNYKKCLKDLTTLHALLAERLEHLVTPL